LGAIEYDPSVNNVSVVNSEFAVYPNPFQSVIYITGSGSYHKVALYSVSGQMVFSGENMATPFILNLAYLKSGVYILWLDGSSRKVVKC